VLRTVEQGEVFFFSREDVQRFFFFMRPDRKRVLRRVVVGRKRLPDPIKHEREWACVAEVTDDTIDIRDETRGVRVEPAARPVAEGRYAIVEHDDHTHFVYVLELPDQPGPAQDVFHVRREASYVMAVRDPAAGTPPRTGPRPRQRAAYPPELRVLFRNRRFTFVTDPRLLDYEGAELVLIGAAEDVESELGIALPAEDEALENADIFRRLRLRPDELFLDPVVRGELD
jgi:hypothetical protein